MHILKKIQELLKEQDIPCTMAAANDEVPYDRLMVVLTSPGSKQEDVAEITAHPQFGKEGFSKEKLTDDYDLIQFLFVLPVTVTPSTFNQVSSALHFFNRQIHCPGFELDEIANQVDYRHVWFVKSKGIDAFLLMQLLGNIHLCYKMFSPSIKEIIEGKTTLEDILKKALELAKQNLEK